MTFFFFLKDIQWACSFLALWSLFIPSLPTLTLGYLYYSIPALAWGWPDGSKCFLVTDTSHYPGDLGRGE